MKQDDETKHLVHTTHFMRSADIFNVVGDCACTGPTEMNGIRFATAPVPSEVELVKGRRKERKLHS